MHLCPGRAPHNTMQQLARPGGQLPLLPTQNHQKHWRLSSAAAAGTAAVQQPATLTSRVLPVKKFHQQQQQQQHVDGHPQQQQQQEPHQQQQQQTLPSLSPGSSRQQARQQKQYGLSRTLQALRSTGVTAAEAARASPQLLTSAITQCESLGEALQVFCEMSAAFNNVHVAAMVARLPKILRSTQQQQQHKPFSRSCSSAVPGPTARLTPTEQSDLQQALCDLSQLSEELLPRCSPREMSNIAWGFAALGFYNRRLMQLLLGRCSLAALKPQEMSNLVWAVAKLGHEVPAAWVDEALLVSGRVLAARSFKPQEAANLAWGLATIQRRCLTSGVAGSGSSGLFSSCVRVDSSWKQGLCQTISEQLGFWQAADMSQGLWALAVLGFSVFQQQWLDRVLVRALQLLGGGRLQSRHAASMLWAVAKLHLQQQQLSGWQSGAAAAAAATNGDSNANSSSSSGSSGGSEVSATVAVFATAIASKLPLLLRDEQQPLRFAAVLCHSYQQLQLQPPAAALDVLLAAAARQLNSLDLSAAAAHAAGDSRPTHSSGRQQQQRRRRPELLLDLSMLLHSLAKLSYRPQAAFMDLVAAVVADSAWRVVDCHDQLATLGTAWAALQQQHDDTHQGVMQQQQEQQEEKEKQQQRQAEREDGTGTGALRASKQQRILQQRQLLLGELQSSLRGRHASLLLWAFAKLHYQPSAEVLRPLKMACLRQRGALNAADVGVLLWALARMRHRPGYAWVRFMLQSFLSSIDDRVSGAADVANVVHALPHLPGGANQRYVLRKKVGQGVLQGVADAAAARFSECGPQELVQLVQGWALLGFRPGGVWVQQHQARVGEVGRAAFSEREWETLQAAYQQLPVEGEGEGEEQVSAA